MSKAIQLAQRALVFALVLALLLLGACILRSLHARQAHPQAFINAQLVKEAYHAAI